MTNDTLFSIFFILYSLLCVAVGAALGMLRRDRDWRILIADQRSADIEFEKHWETAIRD